LQANWAVKTDIEPDNKCYVFGMKIE